MSSVYQGLLLVIKTQKKWRMSKTVTRDLQGKASVMGLHTLAWTHT